MNKRTARALAIAVGVVGFSITILFFMRGPARDLAYELGRPEVPIAQGYLAPTTTIAAPTPKKPSSTTNAVQDPLAWSGTIPSQLNLDVPFLLQAPKQNWVQPFEDACEEAALIMVDAYYDGRKADYEPDEGIKAILEVVAFEDKEYGYNKDTNADEVANTAKEYFGYRRALVREATESSIKSALTNGYPVIVPAYGKALLNPNFRNGGPEYHMLVIKGWTKDGKWITNDPGTRRGPDYIYGKQLLLDAIHDFNAEDMTLGRKVMIVLLPR